MLVARILGVMGLLLFVALPACSPVRSTPKPPPSDLLGKPGGSKADPYPTCGPKNSYRFIAQDFVCRDGSNPFQGDFRAAAQARRGNVGSHVNAPARDIFNSHIVDVYRVPCPEGDVDVYVCMYHCQKR